MLEAREHAYKQGLAERISPQVPAGERIEAIAVCQLGPAPWLQVVPMAVGIVVLMVSVLAASLPASVGVIGALLVLAGIVVVARTPRRLVARTNRNLHLFAMPRSQKAELGAPLATIALVDAPAYRGGPVELGGERIWPNYGSGLERAALAQVLRETRAEPDA
ncbi:MAG: hypothetical protein U0V56_00145 [Actinomycetota bacterium]